MSINELSEELEIGKRQIIRYKEALGDAGINIKTVSGKYGGYVYDDKEYLSSLNVTDDEFIALLAAEQQLIYDDFVNVKDFKKVIEKISSLRQGQEFTLSDYYIKNKSVSFEIEKEKKTWLDINSAIVTNRKIKIIYSSLKNEEMERIIRPYAVFQYDGALYLVGYCELRKDVREFKLSRIKKYEVLTEKFIKDKEFKLQEYMKNSFGIHRDEKIKLKLKIKYPMSQIIKEKIWSENQIITECDENSIIYEAYMTGKTEIKSWILSMGSSAEIIEPKGLRKEVIDQIEELRKIYN